MNISEVEEQALKFWKKFKVRYVLGNFLFPKEFMAYLQQQVLLGVDIDSAILVLLSMHCMK